MFIIILIWHQQCQSMQTQVNVSQHLYAVEILDLPVTMTGNLCQISLCSMM